MIILIAFSQQMGLAIITPSLPEMARELSVSMFSVMGLYMIGMGVGQFFWGSWSDILGRKKLMSIGVFIFAATSFFITVATSPYLINFLRFIQGFSTGAMYSISQAIIADQSETKEYMIGSIAVSDFGFGIAWIILPFIGGIIALLNNWKINFYLMSGFVFIVSLLCLIFVHETRKQELRQQRNIKNTIKLFLSMYKNSQYIVIPLLIAIPNAFFAAFNTTAPKILIADLHKSTMTIGVMASIIGISYTAAIFFNIGFLNKKQSKKIINAMTVLFVMLTAIQLLFAILGMLNMSTLYIPMILNVMVWGIMFPHILGHGLTLYKEDGGTVGSHLGFTFFILAGAATYLFGILFKDNSLGISLFTFIMSIITICLVIYFNRANRLTLNQNPY